MSGNPVVRMTISTHVILNHWLQMPGAQIIGASVEVAPFSDDALTVSLYMRHPGAPEGADEIMPVYTEEGHPGEFRLDRIDWYRDHVKIEAGS